MGAKPKQFVGRERNAKAAKDGAGKRFPNLTQTVLTLCAILCADQKSGAPGTTRTCDLLIRSQTLYPTELRVQRALNSKW